ncbi:MAG: DUF2752 domain-containing protein, partial [Muribaculaceae bacterium]|nr:DUF2752 domain-containing protein [Muribaculaceae bacterium]
MILIGVFHLHITICPSKLIFHIPCPGCGMTRALILLCHGQFVSAIALNPNIIILIPALVAYPILLFLRIKYSLDYITKINNFLKLKKVYIPLAIFE